MTTGAQRTGRYAFAQSLARHAGALADDYFRERVRLTVELKGPQDFVSHADRDVEALLRREIAAAYPGDAFLGEETAASFTGALDGSLKNPSFVERAPPEKVAEKRAQQAAATERLAKLKATRAELAEVRG